MRGLSIIVALLLAIAASTLVGLATYNIAWFQHIERSLTDTPASAAAKNRSLDEVRAALGYGGFLQALTLFAETGSAKGRADMATSLDAADKALRAFEAEKLTPAESDLARDLRRQIDRYRTAMNAGGDRPQAFAGGSGIALMTQHAALADRVAELRRKEAIVSADVLLDLARRGFHLGLGAVALMLLGLTLAFWLVRSRALAPLSELTRSLGALARGDWRAPVWGTHRGDEYGELARTIDGFRQQASELPDVSILSDKGRFRLKFEGESADLFEVMGRTLRASGKELVGTGTAMARLVQDTRAELTGAISQLNGLCAAVAKSASDSNREVRQATELLARAAAQVRAFDDRAGGGLDAIVAELRRHSEALAETMTTAGGEVTHVLRGLVTSEGEIKQTSAEARDATRRLTDAMGDLQEKLFTAVKLLRASGEMLANTAGDAGERLDRAVGAVGDSDRALQQALAGASARLDEVSIQIDRAADLLQKRTEEAGQQFSAALDDLNRATRLVEDTAESNQGRLEPVVHQLQALQESLGGSVADIGSRIGTLRDGLEMLKRISLDMVGEIDKRAGDPDQREENARTIARLHEMAGLLGQRVEAIGDTAERLAKLFGHGIDEATGRLRQTAQELEQQGRTIAGDAATATNALTRALARQDEATESLKAIATDIRPLLVNLPDPAEERQEPMITALSELVESLRDRLETVDRATSGLAELTQSLDQLIEHGGQAAQSAAASRELGERLAEIAAQLRSNGSGGR
ncbi:MAG TPA: HAMP domain-containing protein [Azospirillaceae bacterium]|nr:HAMP domain-containing protein [Azospirillaceae bacterium]